jgi:hypothetical protein
VESLLISLSIEGYYLWSKNAVFWDAFMVVSTIDVSMERLISSASMVRHLWNHIPLRNPED